MMILGGVIPLIQGKNCDFETHANGIMGITWTHFSYVVPLLGFAF
jgi:FHS family L-fucose permease-like MFS transporter